MQLPQARDFLVDHVGGGVSDVEYVGEGAWSRCFGYVLGGHEYVVRFGRHVEDFERDRWASRYASRDLLVPQVVEIGEAFGAWYAISTRAHGTPLEQLDADAWAATMPSLLATMDALRDVDISATTGYGGWDRSGSAPDPSWRSFLAAVADDPAGRRTHGWRQRLLDTPGGDRSFRHAHARMLDLADAFPDERYLVHNDLLNRNALAADGQVTAVFDWGCSIYGDFLYELTTLVFWTPWYPVIDDSDVLSLARAHYADIDLKVPDFDARIRCCALHIGLEHIGYNAFLGDLETLRRTDERMSAFLD